MLFFLQELKWKKDELKKKVKILENELMATPRDVVQDLQKTQVVLRQLENQVQTKQKEREEHLQSLQKEKEQAYYISK